MQNNQQILMGVIIVLILLIGFLVYDRRHNSETFGEKVGHSIDRATDNLNDAVDGKK